MRNPQLPAITSFWAEKVLSRSTGLGKSLPTGVNEAGESSSQRRRNDGAPKSSMRCNIEQNACSVSLLQAEN